MNIQTPLNCQFFSSKLSLLNNDCRFAISNTKLIINVAKRVAVKCKKGKCRSKIFELNDKAAKSR